MDKKIIKQLISPANPGGAPLYVEDVLRLQQHAQSLTIPMMERSAELHGSTLRIVQSTQFFGETKAGFYITPPTFSITSDDGNTANVVVSEFTVLIDGKICVYNGGTLPFASMNASGYDTYFVEVGTELKESRVFRDGVNRELLVTNEVKLTRVPFSPAYGLALGSAYLDAPGVQLTARYYDDTLDESNTFHPSFHPNCFMDTMGLSTPVQRAWNSVQTNTTNVSDWVEVIFNDATGYTKGTGVVEVREEPLSGLLRLRGNVTYNVTNSDAQLIGQLPLGKRPDFDQIVAHVHTDTNELGYLEFKINGEIWAKINVGGGQNSSFMLFDGVSFPGR